MRACLRQFLCKVPSLSSLDGPALSRLADVMTTADYEDGEYIVEVGEDATQVRLPKPLARFIRTCEDGPPPSDSPVGTVVAELPHLLTYLRSSS